MTRIRCLVSVVALVGLAGAVTTTGCNFRAGVHDPSGAAGATGMAGAGAAGTGAAGMGTAGTGTAGVMATGSGGAIYTGVGGSTGTGGAIQPAMCTNLECQQSTCRNVGGSCKVTCPAGQRTTVSGIITDPAGKIPLYNITVFVPNAALDDINDGPSCDPCDPATGTSNLSGKPVTIAKTDETGTFHLGLTSSLGDVPAGMNIPLVIQVGKWRRPVTIPNVTACMDNPIADKDLLRLPRNKTEGHIPKFALTTGQSDAMECLLRKIGIDDTEFSTEAGTGRVNLYQGGDGAASFAPTLNAGASFTPASPWWDSLDNLKKYDIILHSCEGGYGSYGVDNMGAVMEPMSAKSMQARQALQDYADLGGRVFASHWHAYWFERGTPAFMSVGTFNHRAGLGASYDATIDQTFDTGASLAKWMMGPMVMGSTTLGIVNIMQDASTRMIDMAAGGNISQRWIYASTLVPQSVQFLSATTPIPTAAMPKPNACGRAVISDLHVSAGKTGDVPKMPFPTGCITTDLSPREKVLEFMLFDIASCVRPIIP
jgi:hypothetical protein